MSNMYSLSDGDISLAPERTRVMMMFCSSTRGVQLWPGVAVLFWKKWTRGKEYFPSSRSSQKPFLSAYW
jgi:hypothetical protein